MYDCETAEKGRLDLALGFVLITALVLSPATLDLGRASEDLDLEEDANEVARVSGGAVVSELEPRGETATFKVPSEGVVVIVNATS